MRFHLPTFAHVCIALLECAQFAPGVKAQEAWRHRTLFKLTVRLPKLCSDGNLSDTDQVFYSMLSASAVYKVLASFLVFIWSFTSMSFTVLKTSRKANKLCAEEKTRWGMAQTAQHKAFSQELSRQKTRCAKAQRCSRLTRRLETYSLNLFYTPTWNVKWRVILAILASRSTSGSGAAHVKQVCTSYAYSESETKQKDILYLYVWSWKIRKNKRLKESWKCMKVHALIDRETWSVLHSYIRHRQL